MKKTIAILLSVLIITSCELEHPDQEENISQCELNSWASAEKDGTYECIGKASILYWNANTSAAKLSLTAGSTGKVATPEIQANFAIPEEGLELNKEYPLDDGEWAGADQFTSGTITLLSYNPPSCIAGKFELFVENESGTIVSFKNGKFTYSESLEINEACNDLVK